MISQRDQVYVCTTHELVFDEQIVKQRKEDEEIKKKLIKYLEFIEKET